REQTIAVGPRDRAERQDLLARRLIGADNAPRIAQPRDHAGVTAQDVVRAHHADAHELALRPQHRHRPREAVRRDVAPEVQLDAAGTPRRELALRGMKMRARQPEPEAPLEPVRRAAGEYREASAHRITTGRRMDAARVDVERRDARAGPDFGARGG